MIQIRIPKDLYETMRDDLSRPHPHASERVGFAFIRPVGTSKLVVTGYMSVDDSNYIADDEVGARINHKAIIEAMKRADIEGEGILHVHEHRGFGTPRYSKTDLASHGEFLRSFRNANHSGTHGFLLLSQDSLRFDVWKPGEQDPNSSIRYTIVGLPLIQRLLRRSGK